MIINIKNKRGITLISMILTVIVLLIIIGTISYSSRSSFETKKLEDLYSDIDSLYDAISIYYVKNKTLPVYYSNRTITGEKVEYQPIGFSEDDDIYTYHIIDVTKLNNIVLNNKNNVPVVKEVDEVTGKVKEISLFDTGTYSENITIETDEDGNEIRKSDFDEALRAGIFVVNSSTHAVYYTKGVTIDDVTYYTKNDQFSKIPAFSKIDKKRVEDDILDKDKNKPGYNDENITIIFYANGGTDAPNNLNVSREADITLKDTLNNEVDLIPNKNGMKFEGWATFKDGEEPLYSYSDIDEFSYECTGTDIELSQYESNVIELYAVWRVDENNILYYYYPYASGGGVRPTIDNNDFILDRSGIGDAVKNSLCIDIPTSGYTISWDWNESTDESENALKMATYIGESQTSNIQSNSNKMKYQTTESGRLEVSGSFTNFKISLNPIYKNDEGDEIVDENTDIVVLKEKPASDIDDIRVVSFYQTENKKDTCGSKINKEWLTGGNGVMAVPSNLKTYADFGLIDPSELNKTELDYDYAFDENSLYFLRSAIFTNQDSIENSNSLPINYEGNQKQLGSSVQITDLEDCVYLRFAARNYEITRNSGGIKIYHESLQEAYDQCLNENYDKITLLRNVNDFGMYRNSTDQNGIQEKERLRTLYETATPNYYIDTHDPSYAQECILFGRMYTSYVVLDCADYILSRQASINVDYLLSMDIISDTYGKIEFYNNPDKQAIKITDAANLYIKNNTSITSDNGAVINLSDDASLYVHEGIIKNTSKNNSNAITSNSSRTYIYLGIGNKNYDINDNNYIDNGNVIISTQLGTVINSTGNLIWKSGILKTADYTNKQGYNDSLESKLVSRKDKTTNELQKPCVYYDSSEMMVGIKLGIRDWEFEDRDYLDGQVKKYYSDYLQNAHDCINLAEKTANNENEFMKIKWLNPVENSGEMNNATLSKPALIVNFNSYTRNNFTFNTSTLSVNSTKTTEKTPIILENLKTETKKGFSFSNANAIIRNSIIGNSSTGTGIKAITLTSGNLSIGKSNIKTTIYTQKDEYAIYKTGGVLNIDSNTEMYVNGGYAIIRNNKGDVNILDSNLYSKTTATTRYVIVNNANAIIENSIVESKNKNGAIYNNSGGKIDVKGTSQILSNTEGVKYEDLSPKMHTIINYGKINLLDQTKLEGMYGIYTGTTAGNVVVKGQVRAFSKNVAYNFNKAKLHMDGEFTEDGEWIYPVTEVTSTTGTAVYLASGAEFTMGSVEDDNAGYKVIKQLCPVIKSGGSGVYLATGDTKSVFNFNNGIIYGLDNYDKDITTVSTERYNAICNISGTINVPEKYFIERDVNQSIEIQGEMVEDLQKLYIGIDCNFIDNVGNTYDDLNILFDAVEQNPDITEVVINKNGFEITNTNFSPSANRGDVPLTIDFNGKTVKVRDNGIINSGTLIITNSKLDNSENASLEGVTENNVFVIKNESNGKLILSGNGKISSVNRNTILNYGEVIIKDNFEVENNYSSPNPNEFGVAIASNSDSKVNLSGNVKVKSSGYGIAAENNSSANANITITDNVSVQADLSAVVSRNGTVNILTSELSTQGPSIISTSTDSNVIAVEAANLTLGVKDSVVNENYPVIKTRNIGVKVTQSFNFYDGCIFAMTTRDVAGTSYAEDGYSIQTIFQMSTEIDGEYIRTNKAILVK